MSKIKKGDTVKILLGKDRGKTGQVEKVMVKDGKAFVSGINFVKRHVKKHQGVEGGIIDLIKPVDISNILVVCPNCKVATRVGFKIEGNVKMRYCKHCQKEITGSK